MTGFWGRSSESAACTRLLTDADVRLVTLTGPGGVGKTRLAHHVIDELDESDRPRVVLVELAGVVEDDDVLPAIADAMAVNAGRDRDLIDSIAAVTAEVRTLVFLDNVEHLTGIDEVVSKLVEHNPRLTVLATSRVPVGAAFEHVVALASLPVTPTDGHETAPAVGLFLEILAERRISTTPEDLDAITGICAVLGGSPLGIELAASRCTVLTPGELLAGIRRAGAVDALATSDARLRDLRATVEWGLAVLGPVERRMIDAIATFSSWATRSEISEVVGSTLAATEAERLDALTTLVTHHLVETGSGPGTRWFRLHPLVREVVTARLDAGLTHAQDRAAVAFARRSDDAMDTVDGPARLDEIARRHDDLTAALHRALEHGDGEAAAAIVLGLAPFWAQRGGATRQIAAIDRVLEGAGCGALSDADRSGLQAWRCSILVEWRTPATDVVALGVDLSSAVELAIASGSPRAIHRAVQLSARCAPLTGAPGVADHVATALDLAGETGDEFVLARSQTMAALLAHQNGDHDRAVGLATSALLAARRLGAHGVAASAAMVLLIEQPATGDRTPAVSLADVVSDAERAGDRRALAVAHILQARASMDRGDLAGTAEACTAAIRLAVAMGHPNVARVAIATLTVAAAASRLLPEAAALHGVNADHLDGISAMFPPGGADRYRGVIGLVDADMDPGAFARGVAVSRELQWPDALAMVLAQAGAWATSGATPEVAAPKLTGRELDVVRCIAAGLSNKQIAIELGISPKTAAHHTTNLFRKVGVASRAAATAWAYRTGIVTS